MLGYRWWIVENGLLISPKAGTPWLPGQPLSARCLVHNHDAPDPHCECGIYSRPIFQDVNGPVIGMVHSFGQMIENGNQRRAEHAEILWLDDPEMAQRYGVTHGTPRTTGSY